ncbi:MAG TPA: hypothetical protein GX719_00015 [Gammaproteobacteria bacterium]|nr:hypothetical protein [Gammaproteobacteria bacterium]
MFKGSKHDTSTFTPERIAQRIKLLFNGLDIPPLTICWKNNLYFQHLHDLPRGALSGPVQEDKAEAHTLLANLVTKEVDTECVIDLRDIYGLSEQLTGIEKMQDMEAFAASEQCRHVRIISYRDFEKIITTALPHFLSDQPISLRQANWLGEQLFWVGEQHSCEFACAIVYARRRGLELPKRTRISRYSLNIDTLRTVQNKYHMLIMPEQAWSDREFMAILLESGCPYARLALSKAPQPVEVLLLPKHKPLSDNLGRGLKLAGAYDASEILLQLAQA